MLSKEEDFVLGWVIGMIAGHSEVALSAMSGGILN
jgi:hypothetical protein